MELTKAVTIKKIIQDQITLVEDAIIVEADLTVVVNGTPLVTLVCSPKSLEALTVGYLFGEGIISAFNEIKTLRIEAHTAFVETQTGDSYHLEGDHIQGTRRLLTACGKRHQISYPVTPLLLETKKRKDARSKIRYGDIAQVAAGFNQRSALFLSTGGVHSSALAQGAEIRLFEEDIGRHNGFNKIIGTALMEEISLADTFIMTSGRVPEDMVTQLIRSEVPVIVSRSAPTDKAIALSEQYHIGLIGFARNGRMNVYTDYNLV